MTISKSHASISFSTHYNRRKAYCKYRNIYLINRSLKSITLKSLFILKNMVLDDCCDCENNLFILLLTTVNGVNLIQKPTNKNFPFKENACFMTNKISITSFIQYLFCSNLLSSLHFPRTIAKVSAMPLSLAAFIDSRKYSTSYAITPPM